MAAVRFFLPALVGSLLYAGSLGAQAAAHSTAKAAGDNALTELAKAKPCRANGKVRGKRTLFLLPQTGFRLRNDPRLKVFRVCSDVCLHTPPPVEIVPSFGSL